MGENDGVVGGGGGGDDGSGGLESSGEGFGTGAGPLEGLTKLLVMERR